MTCGDKNQRQILEYAVNDERKRINGLRSPREASGELRTDSLFNAELLARNAEHRLRAGAQGNFNRLASQLDIYVKTCSHLNTNDIDCSIEWRNGDRPIHTEPYDLTIYACLDTYTYIDWEVRASRETFERDGTLFVSARTGRGNWKTEAR